MAICQFAPLTGLVQVTAISPACALRSDVGMATAAAKAAIAAARAAIQDQRWRAGKREELHRLPLFAHFLVIAALFWTIESNS